MTKIITGPTVHVQAMTTKKIVILIDPDSRQVVQVAYDIPHLRQSLLAAHPGAALVGGRLGLRLYEAITGRHYHEPPEQASRARAFMTRWRLVKSLDNVGHVADLIAAVVDRYGMFEIDPWLGTTQLDRQGRIL